MKCKFCGKEIEDGSIFCGYCGKEQANVKTCIKCGREIDADDEFCGYCGAKQLSGQVSLQNKDIKPYSSIIVSEPKQEEQIAETIQGSNESIVENTSNNVETTKEGQVIVTRTSKPSTNSPESDYEINSHVEENENSSKKWYIMIAVILIVVLVIGYFYFGRKNPIDSNSVDREELVATESKSVLKDRMQDILSDAIKNSEDSTLYEKYCTADFAKICKDYKRASRLIMETRLPPSMDNFYNIWNLELPGGHGGPSREASTEYDIISDSMSSETNGTVEVSFKPASEYESENNSIYLLDFVNGKWFISDVKIEDASTKDMLSNFNQHVSDAYKEICEYKATPNTQKYGPVWKEISGTYWFQGEGNLESIDVGDSFRINGEPREGTVISSTGEIIVYDSEGKIEFDGYVYDGGNTIVGKWKKREVVLYGVGD